MIPVFYFAAAMMWKVNRAFWMGTGLQSNLEGLGLPLHLFARHLNPHLQARGMCKPLLAECLI